MGVDAIGMSTKTISFLVIQPPVDMACGAPAKQVARPLLPANGAIHSILDTAVSMAHAIIAGVTTFMVFDAGAHSCVLVIRCAVVVTDI